MCKGIRLTVATLLLVLGAGLWGCSSESQTRREPTPGAEKYLEDAREKLEANRYTEARAMLDLARQEGAPAAQTRALTALLERRLAARAAEQNEAGEAYGHFRKAAELEPTDAQRFEDLMAAIEVGRQAGVPAAELAPLASQAVELETRSAKAQRLAAQLWDDAGQPERALPYYQWLRKTDPDDTSVAIRLGTLHLAQDQLAEARRVFESVRQADPDHIIAGLKLAEVHARSGEHEEALAVYEQLAERHPKKPGVLLSFARYLDERGEAERAQKLREQARQAMPGVERREMRKLR